MIDPQLDDPQTVAYRGSFAAWWWRLSGNVRGAILFMLGSVMFALMVATVKLAGERLHVTEVLFFRQLVMVMVALPIILSGWPGSIRTQRPKLQVMRVFFAFGSIVLGFGAFVHLGLAEVTVLTFSKSYFLTILAIMFLGETVSMARWTALMIGFIGVLVIVWPPSMSNGISFWHLAAVASAFCVAVVMVIIRILSRVDRPVTILTYQAVGVGILLTPAAIYFWQMPTGQEWLLILAIGVLSAAAQYVNILAFRAAEASALAPLEYTRLVLAAAIGFWLFGEWPGSRVWIGAAIIIGAALFVVHRERRKGRSGTQAVAEQTGK